MYLPTHLHVCTQKHAHLHTQRHTSRHLEPIAFLPRSFYGESVKQLYWLIVCTNLHFLTMLQLPSQAARFLLYGAQLRQHCLESESLAQFCGPFTWSGHQGALSPNSQPVKYQKMHLPMYSCRNYRKIKTLASFSLVHWILIRLQTT